MTPRTERHPPDRDGDVAGEGRTGMLKKGTT
jgi:hypothetical protein